jgi:hypothetical protein
MKKAREDRDKMRKLLILLAITVAVTAMVAGFAKPPAAAGATSTHKENHASLAANLSSATIVPGDSITVGLSAAEGDGQPVRGQTISSALFNNADCSGTPLVSAVPPYPVTDSNGNATDTIETNPLTLLGTVRYYEAWYGRDRDQIVPWNQRQYATVSACLPFTYVSALAPPVVITPVFAVHIPSHDGYCASIAVPRPGQDPGQFLDLTANQQSGFDGWAAQLAAEFPNMTITITPSFWLEGTIHETCSIPWPGGNGTWVDQGYKVDNQGEVNPYSADNVHEDYKLIPPKTS